MRISTRSLVIASIVVYLAHIDVLPARLGQRADLFREGSSTNANCLSNNSPRIWDTIGPAASRAAARLANSSRASRLASSDCNQFHRSQWEQIDLSPHRGLYEVVVQLHSGVLVSRECLSHTAELHWLIEMNLQDAPRGSGWRRRRTCTRGFWRCESLSSLLSRGPCRP